MRIHNFLLLLTVVLSNTVSAQLSLNWRTVDGGGGTSASADGRFTLSGTAGQPDAGMADNGGFVLRGGFWNNVNSVLAPAPSLSIALLANGDVEVSWPVWAGDYVLEHAPTVVDPPGGWDDVPPATYQNDGTRFYIIVPAPTDTQFYRLYQVCPGP